jgi:DNA-binding transcriptional ArsR family regulator
MTLPAEFFSTPLNHPEFRLAVSLYHLSDAVGRVDATLDELEVLTSMSHESLRRALRGLEGSGLLETVRTKRNLGKYYTNRYRLLLPSLKNEGEYEELPHKNVDQSEPLPHKNEGSTGGQVVPIGTGKLTSYVSNVSSQESTTYFLVRTEGAPGLKEIPVGNPERWKPRGEDTTGDDSIGGFGLLDEPVSAPTSKLSVNARDPKTRGRRPEHEWSANDVAVEFSYQLGRRFPYTPGLVNVRALGGALRANRSKFGITAQVELEILRMFFEDEGNLRDIEKHPNKIHGRFLNMFKSHLQTAHQNLGLEVDYRLLASDLDTPISETPVEDVLIASDGVRFDNTAAGRAFLELHESKLRGED